MRPLMKSVAAILVCLGLSASLDVAIPGVAMAQQTANWNGTWIGNWSGGNGTQIVFADNELIAMYWGGDYLSDTPIQPVAGQQGRHDHVAIRTSRADPRWGGQRPYRRP